MKFTYNDDNRHSSVCSVYTLKPQQGQVSKAHQVSVCEKGKPNPSFENKKVTYLQNHRQQHSCSLFPFVSLCLMVSWSFLYTLKDTLQHISIQECVYTPETQNGELLNIDIEYCEAVSYTGYAPSPTTYFSQDGTFSIRKRVREKENQRCAHWI